MSFTSGTRKNSSSLAAIIALLAFFLALDLATVPGNIGDTLIYSGHILKYSHDGSTAAPGVLWEFGHLLWRPLGYAFWKLAFTPLAELFAGNPVIEITAALFAINFVSGVALTLLIFAISRKLGLQTRQAFLVTVGFLLCNAVLNWLHSGSAYVPGLSLHLLGVWFMLRAATEPRHRPWYAVAAGAALALASGIWFPFVLSIPAALLLGLLAEPLSETTNPVDDRERIRVVAIATVAVVAFGLLIFLGGAALNHISSISGFKAWVANSGHGVKAERTLVRLPTGMTRTFLYMNDDEGIILKRFVFGDPYAPVRWTGLIGAGLWKIVLVFVTFCVLFWSLFRVPNGRPALLVVLAGMLPTIGFATVLFETSGSERYFPLYAALLVGICIVLRDQAARAAHLALAIFLVVMAVVNLRAFVWDLRVYARTSSDRFRLVHDHTRHGGVALILSFKDPLSTYFQRSPFDPENQLNALPLFHVAAEFNGVPRWRPDSSCRVLQAWSAGGEAWLSKRLAAPRPLPDWQWSENDHPLTHWVDLYGFFRQLDMDTGIGDTDGFLRIAKDPKNQAILQNNCDVANNAQ